MRQRGIDQLGRIRMTHVSPKDRLNSLVRENVIAQLANIKTHPSVALATAQGRLRLHGWVYDIETGSIDVLDEATRTFSSLSDYRVEDKTAK